MQAYAASAFFFFFFNDTATTEIYTLSLHDALPISDSSRLGDGMRVLSRSLERIAAECKDGALNVVHHGRAVKYRLLEIGRAAKSLTDANKQRMRDSYKKLVGLTRGVMRQASEVVQRW